MKTRFKAPLEEILARGQVTLAAMDMLAPEWTAPYFMTPAEFAVLLEEVRARKAEFYGATVAMECAAGRCEVALGQWHEASVAVVTIGRITFKQSEHAPVWARLRATGQGRERILSEGAQIESAWQSSDAAWVPKPGLTLAAYQALGTAAVAADGDCTERANALSVARGILHERANLLHQVCVDWYAVALVSFPADSPQANAIRHILSPRRSRAKPVVEASPPVSEERTEAAAE